MSDLSHRHEQFDPVESLKEIGARLYKDLFTTEPTTKSPKALTRTQNVEPQGLSAPDTSNQSTTVRFQAGDTLWDLAERKYKGPYSLGAIYEANGLTPKIIVQAGERKFVAPTCYAGQDYILPAQKDLPQLEQKFKQRIRLENEGQKGQALTQGDNSQSKSNPNETVTLPPEEGKSPIQGTDKKRESIESVTSQVEQFFTQRYSRAQDYVTQGWYQFKGQLDELTVPRTNGNPTVSYQRYVPSQNQPSKESSSSVVDPEAITSFLKSKAQSYLVGLSSTITNEVTGNGLIGRFWEKGKEGLGSLSQWVDSAIEELPKEVPPPESLPVLPGSYYRKLASSFDPEWQGIKTTITLGTPSIDNNRRDKRTLKPLDGISVYLGGNANGQEIDAGLTWEATIDKSGNVSQVKRAWRPFWFNVKWGNAPAKEEFYWHPGETVEMSVVRSKNPGWLTLSIRDLGPNPKRSFVTEIKADQFQPGVPCQFKAVTSIDQKAGQQVVPTTSCLIGTNWQNMFLLRGSGQGSAEVPLTTSRRAQLISHEEKIFVSPTGDGLSHVGEMINIGCFVRKI